MLGMLLSWLGLATGCATSMEPPPGGVAPSPEREALNICFAAEDQRGWRWLRDPPPNYRALADAARHEGFSLVVTGNSLSEFWFERAGGRYAYCKVMPLDRDVPVQCARQVYEFRALGEGWSVDALEPPDCKR
jgi:hypothetical protein